MSKQEAYTIVFDDLMECGLFRGIYDARHGNEDFMYGIGTVMEVVAYGVNSNMAEAFNSIFNANMIASERKVEK